MEKDVKCGFVGYFDIMGYQNFLKNNSVKDCADIIKKILIKMPNLVKKRIKKGFEDSFDSSILSLFNKQMKSIMLSDTIVFLYDCNGISEDQRDIQYSLVVIYLLEFYRECFLSGFPMRGCVNHGTYYCYKTIFAGESIIKCHSLSSSLEFAGVVFTDEVSKVLNEKYSDSLLTCNNFKYFLVPYLVPIKDESELALNLGRWYFLDDYDQSNDIFQFIFGKFHSHNKDIPNKIMHKVFNTEKILRYFILQEKKVTKKVD